MIRRLEGVYDYSIVSDSDRWTDDGERIYHPNYVFPKNGMPERLQLPLFEVLRDKLLTRGREATDIWKVTT